MIFYKLWGHASPHGVIALLFASVASRFGGNQVTRAYAEAVVQRVAKPVNGDWDGIEPESKNHTIEYGRKFEIISFRWLNVNEL